MFDIRDAEIVQEIARAGGFRAAAAKLQIAQSALSARVAALEERLGIRIFERRHRGVGLTPVGRDFLDHTGRLIAMRDGIVSRVSPLAGFAGTVRIGVAETIVHTWFPRMLTRMGSMPGIRLELSVDTSPVMSRKLLEDELDVAVLMRQLAPDRAVSSPIYSCALAWFAAPSIVLPQRPAGLADLAQYPIVTFSKGTIPYRELERLFADPHLPAPLLHGCASLSTTMHLVRDGFGIGLLPAPMAEADLATGRLRRIETTPEVRISDLEFVLAHMPAQNGEMIAALHQAALSAAAEIDSA
ncbi:LysR family transcriptional regulator [Rhodoligotrophos defluvii]|uniref:LysR family transcriptional regulator n=1 Tax=Rhodoligotrophos defluvii TaxID=2561934 RepID=UPI0010CA106A|nr:LysR family transcriptional regulator [Rhodoligotrophos defluvii]